MSGHELSTMRRLMVSNQLRPSKVTDPLVLAAMGSLPRELFAPAESAAVCYRDSIVRISGDRGLTTPIATGRLLDRARVAGGDRALVVGAATGYVAALLARLGARVVAVEQDAALLAIARVALADFPVLLVEGPIAEGRGEDGPYDLIYLDGAVERVPDALIAQLAPGGRLVGGIAEGRVTHLIEGRRAAGGFGTVAFADVEMAPLPGFAPAPAFAF